MIDLFNTIIKEEKLHRNFKKVRDDFWGYEPARKTLNEVYNSITDIDPDFLKQFQGEGFDARIWELYLAATFQDLQFKIHRNYARPDFELEKDNKKIFVEAVTSNPGTDDELKDKTDIFADLNEKNIMQFIYDLREKSMVKLAGALYNKLKKEYWNLEWVKNNPLILAVEPFHHSMAHLLSDSNLNEYLYGVKYFHHYDEKGNLQVQARTVIEYQIGNKIIPANFFKQPNAEFISAVVFSNSGTIAKFNRMGKLKGYGDSNIKMIRIGNQHLHDPNATDPLLFKYTVGENGPMESWAQGISMYHNPQAIHPIERKLFPDILHGYFDTHFYAHVPPFYPYQSETHVIIPEEYKDKKKS
ncbi:hypothetical protein ACFS6H_00245 [Terrimonas rubra]|uniref:Uncharacterized protein n=1 Tax=Terrimonas rubra TaxID=1035890 RepID=A0ABW5ZYS0_9BACT